LKEFARVLVANRGEIALRIIRALKTLEIESVAVYSDVDVSAMHVFEAERAFRLKGVYPKETYLNSKKIIEIARSADCDAVHPGYGFLSENADFSSLCRQNSLKFIGPSPETLLVSGNKLECKKIADAKGIPVIPYSQEPLEDPKQAMKFASEIGFPVLLKSAYGGGGRGIKEAKTKEQVKEAFESSKREASSAFGRFAVYVEKKLERPRHIEVQILASDDSAEILHLGERECSIQRRYQKLVEISPSPIVDEETREQVCSRAVSMGKAVKYSNAGTVEFLRDSSSGEFYFLEINSRLQVEHPVTELVTGVDLVVSQIHLAKGKRIPFKQNDVSINGSAIECRINSEDPNSDFVPVTGSVDYLRMPGGPGIRVDSALYNGLEISPYYDSLLAKLISWGSSFDQARRRELTALNEFKIVGLSTTIPFHIEVMRSKEFANGSLSTSFIEESGINKKLTRRKSESDFDQFAAAALILWSSRENKPDLKKTQVIPPWLRETGGGRFVDGL
jgi:acetyl-CoA/propionyl-CoA carboxylase